MGNGASMQARRHVPSGGSAAVSSQPSSKDFHCACYGSCCGGNSGGVARVASPWDPCCEAPRCDDDHATCRPTTPCRAEVTSAPVREENDLVAESRHEHSQPDERDTEETDVGDLQDDSVVSAARCRAGTTVDRRSSTSGKASFTGVQENSSVDANAPAMQATRDAVVNDVLDGSSDSTAPGILGEPYASAVSNFGKILRSKASSSDKPFYLNAANTDLSPVGVKSRSKFPGLYERDPSFQSRLARASNSSASSLVTGMRSSPPILTPTFVPAKTQLHHNLMREKGIPANEDSQEKLFTFGLENVLDKVHRAERTEPIVMAQDDVDKLWDDINKSFASLLEDVGGKVSTPAKSPARVFTTEHLVSTPDHGTPKVSESPKAASSEDPDNDTLSRLADVLLDLNAKAIRKFQKDPAGMGKCKQLITDLRDHIVHEQIKSDWNASTDDFLLAGLGNLRSMLTDMKTSLEGAENSNASGQIGGTFLPTRDGYVPKDARYEKSESLVFVDTDRVQPEGSSEEDPEATSPHRCTELAKTDAARDTIQEQYSAGAKTAEPIDEVEYLQPEEEEPGYGDKIVQIRRELVYMCREVSSQGLSRRKVFGVELFEMIKRMTAMNGAGWNRSSYEAVEPILTFLLLRAKEASHKYLVEHPLPGTV